LPFVLPGTEHFFFNYLFDVGCWINLTWDCILRHNSLFSKFISSFVSGDIWMTWYPDYFYDDVFFLLFIYFILYSNLVWSKRVLNTHKGAKRITKDYRFLIFWIFLFLIRSMACASAVYIEHSFGSFNIISVSWQVTAAQTPLSDLKLLVYISV